MSYPNVPEHTRDDDGFILDEDNNCIFCDVESCDSEALAVVPVSVNAPHDDHRHYCDSHYQVYLIGVQHGRFHEAAVHGAAPSKITYLDKPPTH